MKLRYDVEKMERIISDLCVLTGISMSFLDAERRTLCRYTRDEDFCSLLQSDAGNKRLCSCSDELILNRCMESKRFESHICHAGLFDAAMPIIKDGIFAGIVLMGRVKYSNNADRKELSSEMKEKYDSIPTFNEAQISSLGSLLPNVLFESAIFIEHDSRLDEIVEYIKNNLTEKLSVDVICKRFLMSKNSLYAVFGEHLGTTVAEYITDARLERAKAMLRDTAAPVYEIAESVGVNNYTYFCKLFKKREGRSPTQYRRDCRA